MDISKETFIKMQYMLSQLKPDDSSYYVIFTSDETLPIKYNGNDVILQKGVIIHKNDEEIPWDKITDKYRTTTNKEFFSIIIFRYIAETIVNIWKERLSINTKIDRDLFEKTLVGFNESDMFSIALDIQNFCNDDKDITDFFDLFNKQEHSEFFKTPICLIPLFTIRKFQEKTINNWQFSNDELKELLRIMNISDDIL